MRFSKYLGILKCVWCIHIYIYIHLCVCVKPANRHAGKNFKSVTNSTCLARRCIAQRRLHPTKLSTVAGSSLINSAYLLFKYWFSISWWRPAKPRTGTHFHSWLVLEQYVLALTGFRPRKPQGVDFVTIIKFQFRASNYSQQCVSAVRVTLCNTPIDVKLVPSDLKVFRWF